MLPPEIKDLLRDKVRVTDVVRRDLEAKGQQVRTQGDQIRTVCPFESGSTNSSKFLVSADRFYCFACGEKGDVFDWFKKFHGLDWPAARDAVAALAGVDLTPYLRRRPETPQERSQRLVTDALAVLAELSKRTAEALPPEERQIQGLSVDALIASGEIGLLPDAATMRAALDEHGVEPGTRKAAGLSAVGAEFARRWVFWGRKRDKIVAGRLWGRPSPVVGVQGARSTGWTLSPKGLTPEERNRGALIATTDLQYLRLRHDGVGPVARPIALSSLQDLRSVPQGEQRQKPPVVLLPEDDTVRAEVFPQLLAMVSVNPRLRAQDWEPSHASETPDAETRYKALTEHAGTVFDWQLHRLLALGVLQGPKASAALGRLDQIVEAVGKAPDSQMEHAIHREAVTQWRDSLTVDQGGAPIQPDEASGAQAVSPAAPATVEAAATPSPTPSHAVSPQTTTTSPLTR